MMGYTQPIALPFCVNSNAILPSWINLRNPHWVEQQWYTVDDLPTNFPEPDVIATGMGSSILLPVIPNPASPCANLTLRMPESIAHIGMKIFQKQNLCFPSTVRLSIGTARECHQPRWQTKTDHCLATMNILVVILYFQSCKWTIKHWNWRWPLTFKADILVNYATGE